MRFVGKWVAAALVTGLCLSISCGSEYRQINLLVIGIDTLRRDHLGCYGYDRPTSPNIDRLAEGGTLFEDAVSQSPWTLPSFATVFTSLYPTQHGAGFLEPGAGQYGNRMRTAFPPMAMILLKQGYSTGAIINGPALAPDFGVDRGFEYYDTTPRWDTRDADVVTEDALDWIDQNRDNPFFIFVHYFDPHVTYGPPAPYDTIFDPDYSGRLGNSFDRGTYIRMQDALSIEGDPRAEADWNHVRALYDGEILFTDYAVGELLKGLDERGLRDNTLIILLSDHGEEFFDHKGFEHGHTLYDELIKIPLIFSLPGVVPKGVRIEKQVRLLDVLPTSLDILGMTQTTHMEGSSLWPLMTGDADVTDTKVAALPQQFAFSESMLYGTEKKSITAYPWKLIYDTVSEDQMLFNLAHDPGEHDDLSGRHVETEEVFEEVLIKTLFGLSETWYVEMDAGGQTHIFDIQLSVPLKPMAGSFKMHRFFDSDGRLVDSDRLRLEETSNHMKRSLTLEGLETKGKITLALKVGPKQVPLTFDLRIDGEHALHKTLMGENLTSPENIPFTKRAKRRDPAKGMPASRPQPPYFVVWHSGQDYEIDTPVELGDDTKQQLRALGYIQ
jgi:arylsulfatase A-like enzyme